MRFNKNQVEQIISKKIRRNSFRGGMLYLALGFLFGVFLSHSREVSKWWYDKTTEIKEDYGFGFVRHDPEYSIKIENCYWHPRYPLHKQGGAK